MEKNEFRKQPGDCCGTGEDKVKPGTDFNPFRYWKPVAAMLLLFTGLGFDYVIDSPWFTEPVRLTLYIAAYLPVGLPVLIEAFKHLKKGTVFTEFFLMGIATLGAFYIGEYPEGVAVMLFYSIGEAFQHRAAHKAKENIKALLDVRSQEAHVYRSESVVTVHPETVQKGEVIQVKPGERLPLDGELITERAAFDTSAITGESRPRHFNSGETVLAGMINLNRVIELRTTRLYSNSSIARILEMVEHAQTRKATTELFIRSFAKVYTPVVVALSALLVLLPAFFVSPYVFEDWFYRGLVFLVISCPCALVISIPLGYFGGIGAASKNGILVKGGNFLDALKSVKTVVFDKTGTLTKGTFSVRKAHFDQAEKSMMLSIAGAVEKNSTHPIAKAILEYTGKDSNGMVPVSVEEQFEIPGFGVQAKVNGSDVLIGSEKLMNKKQVILNGSSPDDTGSVVHVSIDGTHKGYFVISDELKEDADRTVKELKKLGVSQTIMLSGDDINIARQIGERLGIDHIYGNLLPEEKAEKLEALKIKFPGTIAYAGDGINDAPVLALSDVGIAMGAMGSDVAIETADVVIQTDQPSKIATAIRIGRSTRNIVWQNIGMAMGVKLLFLGLGAFGLATLWEAVFADVGVALLAILNAIRIQKMNFL